MRPDKKLLVLILGAAGVWAFGMLGLSLVFLSFLSDTDNYVETYIVGTVFVIHGVILGVVAAFLVALLLSISVAALNELGLFAPWSRLRVRVWALTTSLATLVAMAVGYRSSPGVRSSIKMFFGLFSG